MAGCAFFPLSTRSYKALLCLIRCPLHTASWDHGGWGMRFMDMTGAPFGVLVSVPCKQCPSNSHCTRNKRAEQVSVWSKGFNHPSGLQTMQPFVASSQAYLLRLRPLPQTQPQSVCQLCCCWAAWAPCSWPSSLVGFAFFFAKSILRLLFVFSSPD